MAFVMPAIWWASRGGFLQEVRNLLAMGMDVNEKGGHHQTSPLHEAANANHEEVVKLLLTHGADASAKDRHQQATMHYLILKNRVEMLMIFLQHGVEVSPTNRRGLTPLHFAVDNHFGVDNHFAVDNQLQDSMAQVLLLLENGADVDVKSTDGLTPLHLAARRGLRVIARLLIHKKADIESETNVFGRTAEEIATANGNVEVAVILSAEAERLRVRRVAFAMGLHDRLGAGSIVRALDPEVVRLVLQR